MRPSAAIAIQTGALHGENLPIPTGVPWPASNSNTYQWSARKRRLRVGVRPVIRQFHMNKLAGNAAWVYAINSVCIANATLLMKILKGAELCPDWDCRYPLFRLNHPPRMKATTKTTTKWKFITPKCGKTASTAVLKSGERCEVKQVILRHIHYLMQSRSTHTFLAVF